MYKIRDCEERLVGNPDGYKSLAMALSVMNRHNGKVYKALQAAMSERSARDPGARLYSRVEWEEC
jgi:hypothetical protein